MSLGQNQLKLLDLQWGGGQTRSGERTQAVVREQQ